MKKKPGRQKVIATGVPHVEIRDHEVTQPLAKIKGPGSVFVYEVDDLRPTALCGIPFHPAERTSLDVAVGSPVWPLLTFLFDFVNFFHAYILRPVSLLFAPGPFSPVASVYLARLLILATSSSIMASSVFRSTRMLRPIRVAGISPRSMSLRQVTS